jgi:hypothetical protein
MISPTTELRLKLAAIGITPLPSTITKEVFLPEWTTRIIDRKEILSWENRRDAPNTFGADSKPSVRRPSTFWTKKLQTRSNS